MPFLTLEDPNARIKGSRDALGALPIWSSFARHVVTNLTTQSTSVRGFTILLLGRYFAAQLIDERTVPREEALNVFLRMEQIGAYVRHVAHGVGGDIRGIERVKLFLDEHRRRVPIRADSRGMILSDQKVYGLWGLYSVSARVSGLISEGPIGVTDTAARFIEENYLPHLNDARRPLMRLLARGGVFDVRRGGTLFNALSKILPESFTAAEVSFYGHHLRDAREVPSPRRDHQLHLRELIDEASDLDDYFGRSEALALAERARTTDDGLARRLQRIAHLEALLAPADALFDFVLTQSGRRPEDVADAIRAQWGDRVPNLDRAAFADLLPEIATASTRELAGTMDRCHESLESGQYELAVRALLEWNTRVMAGRKAGPWVTLTDIGRLDVRYRGMEHLMPTKEELPELWRNSYFVDALKSVTAQLRNVS